MVKFDKDLYKYTGEQIKEAREKKNMSLQDLSDAINNDKSKQSIMRYENGTSRIDMKTLEKICNILGLNAEEVRNEAKRRMASMDDELTDIQKAYMNASPQVQKAVRLMLGLDK